jgi:hypothetical protein
MVKKSNCSLFENDKKMTNIIFCPVVCLNRKGWLVAEGPAGRPVLFWLVVWLVGLEGPGQVRFSCVCTSTIQKFPFSFANSFANDT